jgi:SAM-dependent methyltransferase
VSPDRPWEEQRPDRARFFDRVADDYDAVRPRYSPELYDALWELAGLGPSPDVLEIGAGTGQATVDLAERAGSVTAVELGPALAARLRERVAGRSEVAVLEGDARTVELASASFDLVASATAWHWIDPVEGLRLAHRVLRDAGALAVWWHVFGDPDRPDPFGDAVGPVLDALFPSRSGAVASYALDEPARIAALEEGGLFEVVATRRFPWEGHHDAASMARLFATFSGDHDLGPDERRRVASAVESLAAERFDGHVSRPYVTVLYVARRVERTP